MKIQLDGATIFLGRLRKDGFRNVERIRLTSFRPLLAKLRKARVRGRMEGTRLYVQPDDPCQLTFLKVWESAG